MQLNKIKQTALILTVSALTACANTAAPSATQIRLPEAQKPRPVAAELLIEHNRPTPPENGSPESLLNHAAHFGAYCQKLANQVSGWQAWYQQGNPKHE